MGDHTIETSVRKSGNFDPKRGRSNLDRSATQRGLDVCSPGCLKGVCELQDSRLSKGRTENLQAYGQSFCGLSTRHRDTRHAGQ